MRGAIRKVRRPHKLLFPVVFIGHPAIDVIVPRRRGSSTAGILPLRFRREIDLHKIARERTQKTDHAACGTNGVPVRRPIVC